jgi:hypothetical protein
MFVFSFRLRMYRLHRHMILITQGKRHTSTERTQLFRRIKRCESAMMPLGGEEAVDGGQAEPALGLQLPELHGDVDPHPGRGGGCGLHPGVPHLGYGAEVPPVAAVPGRLAGGSPLHALLELLRHQQRDVRHGTWKPNPLGSCY